MPRGYLKEKEYKTKDLELFIFTKSKEKKISIKALADLLGCSRSTFYRKLNEGSFTFTELLEMFKALKVTGEEITKLLIV